MTSKIYETYEIKLIDNSKIIVGPLKIFYLRQFMDKFNETHNVSKEENLDILIECCLIAMQQYRPEIKTIEQIEDILDMNSLYKLIEYCAGIKLQVDDSEPVNISKPEENKETWDTLDLAKLESEIFLLGIWKDYEELEKSLSLSEMFATLSAKRDMDYQDKKFTASLKGINLDEATGKQDEDPWEAMKARVAAKTSGIGNGDPNDITALQGLEAQRKGFGIGMGIDYEVVNS